MGFVQQTWTLTLKNLLIVWGRHFISTTFRALVLPVVFMLFISEAKTFFVPPSQFGIGQASPVRSLNDALQASLPSRKTVAFVNNGLGGDVATVINQLSSTVRAAGKNVEILANDTALDTVCHSSLRGVTGCYGAASFVGSPSQGPGRQWNYTLRADGGLGSRIYVGSDANDAQIYVLPFQHAIDAAIASVNGGSQLPATVEQYVYTDETQEERARNITRLYQGTLQSIIAVAFFIGIVGVTYQLVGHMATERELGMSQLIEAMMPNKRRWEPQAARLLANHLAFDIIYLPGWIIMGLIVAYVVFPQTNVGTIVGLHLLIGFSLSSFSIFFGAFFKKAQLSGITTTIASLVLAVIAQIPLGKHGSSGAVIILSLLFPPMNYVFFLIYNSGFQQLTQPTVLSRYSPATDWQVRGTTFFVFFAIQIIVYPFLGAAVERSFYGTASQTRKMHHDAQAQPSGPAVRLQSFSKIYRPGFFKRNILCCGRRKYKNEVVAVNDLNLDILRGQIMVLLGANGSGKSTTLDAIAGLNTVSKGSIDIDATGGLGLCPQKNVLWDELTVAEHVKIFCRLKTAKFKTSESEISNLVAACDLQIKLNAKSATLSGGQRRKLHLALMFVGGSRVCCVDEVSSGIDPLARRKIWDILLNERGNRTILFTSHFLDECEVLADDIAILSKGVLKAQGTAVELKHNFGSGYRASISKKVELTEESKLGSLNSHVDYENVVYTLADSRDTAAFLSKLERMGITDYGVQGPTIEDVFLRLADETRTDHVIPGKNNGNKIEESDDASGDQYPSKTSTESKPRHEGLNLLTGRGTELLQQSVILFRKRFDVLQHNPWPYVAAVLIPVVAAGLVTRFLIDFTALGCNPDQGITPGEINGLESQITADIVYGPPDAVPTRAIEAAYPALNSSSLHPVTSEPDFNNFIAMNFHNATPGGLWLGQNGQTPIFAWLGAYTVSYAALIQNAMNSLLTGSLISTSFQPFAIPFAPQAGKTLQLILYFGLVMSATPAFFALYPTAERLRKVRPLHYSNGVRSGPLWSAYTAFDFLFVLLISALTVIIFVSRWSGWYYPGYLFVVFSIYGLTSIVYSYVISLFTTSQLATFAFAAGSQCIAFLIYFIAYLAILTYGAVNEIDHDVSVAHFTIALVTPAGSMARALLLTLNEFSLLCRGTSVAAYPGDITVYGGPILYLLVQFFLLLAFLIWWDSGGRLNLAFLKRKSSHTPDVEDAATTEPQPDQDSSVPDELARVASSPIAEGLRVTHLSKIFGTVSAVQDVTFAIRKSEVFALLGPNGAGKSTTISLIRGDLRPSSHDNSHIGGDIFVEGVSLSKHRAAARNHMGVCPQFDAIDSMTVLQHLIFYARVRGVTDPAHNAGQLMAAVGLTPYASRLAAKLSGGNKRKLSLAIALSGNPSVLLLDEPSSGMDAAAKRVMWRVLASVTDNRALLVTTHSMEECAALIVRGRAGIMAGRMLAVGTTEELRQRHGDALHVHMVHCQAPHTSEAEMERVKRWVSENVPSAVVEDRTYCGQLRFAVPHKALLSGATQDSPKEGFAVTSGDGGGGDGSGVGGGQGASSGVSALFNLLESNRDTLRFSYYSVSPTTLDQVFLNVVHKHNVREENYAREHEGAKRAGGRKGLVARVLRR